MPEDFLSFIWAGQRQACLSAREALVANLPVKAEVKSGRQGQQAWETHVAPT